MVMLIIVTVVVVVIIIATILTASSSLPVASSPQRQPNIESIYGHFNTTQVRYIPQTPRKHFHDFIDYSI